MYQNRAANMESLKMASYWGVTGAHQLSHAITCLRPSLHRIVYFRRLIRLGSIVYTCLREAVVNRTWWY